MIPKRALFYWDHKSPQVSWLRMQSMVTFARLNPDWEIVTLDGHDAPDSLQGDDRLHQVLRSDYCRYKALSEDGGLYLDTDIVFTKPVPDYWLSGDVLVTVDNGHTCGIAVLGASPDNKFFASLVQRCADRLSGPVVMAYQSLGIKILHSIDLYATAATMGLKLTALDKDTHLVVQWGLVEKLWSPITIHMPRSAIGLHWFGGDPLSIEYEQKFDDPEFRRAVQCPVADALGELIERAA